MSSALDMSLDDIINKNKKSSKRSRGSGESGPSRRPPSRSANRAAPYATARKAPESAWQHDLYSEQTARLPAPAGARAAAIETGTKLYVSNLDYGVSNDDIKELFAEVGDLKRSSVHYDRSGRSKGTADVVFSRRADALAAVKRYNNVQLDGKPMKIEIVGTNISTPAAGPLVSNGGFENPNSFARSGPSNIATRVGSTRGPRGGGGRGRNTGRGRGGGKSRAEPLSASNLDADLEKYHQEAMQTN